MRANSNIHLDLLWVTNLSAPYRRPVWATLAETQSVGVLLLARSEPGRDWSSELPPSVERVVAGTLHVAMRDKYALYVLRHDPLRHWQPRVVILPGWETPACWQLLTWAKRRGIATVAFYESWDASHRFRGGPVAALRSAVLRSVNAVVTVGEASATAVSSWGVPECRIVKAYNAVDAETFAPWATSGGPELRNRFLYAGQLIERKAVDQLLRAIADSPSAILTIAGEGPLLNELMSLVVDLGVGSRVSFVGQQKPADLAALLGQHSCLVLPSQREVYGMVVCEALFAGRHVVVSDQAGVAVDVASVRGVFVTSHEHDSLRRAMMSSTKAWTGPIADRDLSRWTPVSMASSVNSAMKIALNSAG